MGPGIVLAIGSVVKQHLPIGFMKLILSAHTAKIKKSSNPALFKIIAMNAVGTDYKFYLTEMLAT